MSETQSGSAVVAQSSTSAEASIDSLFGDDGSLTPADEVQEVSVQMSAEEILDEFAPAKLDQIKENIHDLPGTKQELCEYHVEKLDVEIDEDAGGENALKVVEQKAETRPVEERIRLDEASHNQYDEHLDECPKCGEEDVGASRQILQTRSADESGTEIAHLECGCVTRHTD